MGLRPDGTAVCWGDNFRAQLEVPGAPFRQVAAGGYLEDCGVRTDGSLACWGSYSAMAPRRGRFTQVTMGQGGDYSGCALRVKGSIVCWDASPNRWSPGPRPPGGFVQVSEGSSAVCALSRTGRVSCWGRISPPPRGLFTQMSVGTGGVSNFADLCAVKMDGGVQCWGYLYVTIPAAEKGK